MELDEALPADEVEEFVELVTSVDIGALTDDFGWVVEPLATLNVAGDGFCEFDVWRLSPVVEAAGRASQRATIANIIAKPSARKMKRRRALAHSLLDGVGYG